MKTTATKEQVLQAVSIVNNREGYQISLNRADQSGKWFNFTLKSPSKVAGARISATGRNLPKASWHAHGYIFEEIFELNPDAVIWSGGNKIDANEGNWQDRNVGSIYRPCYFSETSIL